MHPAVYVDNHGVDHGVYIDCRGEIVLDPGAMFCFSFREGLAKVMRTGKYGFITASGECAIEPRLEHAYHFSGGLCAATETWGDTRRYGYIGRNGDWVLPQAYGSTTPFCEGIAYVAEASPSLFHSAINADGLIISPVTSVIGDMRCSQGRFPCWQADADRNMNALRGARWRYGYRSPHGEWIIAPTYTYADMYVLSTGTGMGTTL